MFSNKLKRGKSFNAKHNVKEELQLPELSHLSRNPNVSLKHSQSDRKPTANPQFRRRLVKTNLEKRKSVSLDTVVLQHDTIDSLICGRSQKVKVTKKCASDFDIEKQVEKKVEFNQVLRELKMRHRSTSQNEYDSLEKINEEKGQVRCNQTQPFPIENSVDVRHPADAVRKNNYRSQTIHEFAYGNLQQQLEENYEEIQIDIKGVVKICYDSASKKLNKNQLLTIFRNQMLLINDKGEKEIVITDLNKTQYIPVSKKEIRITKVKDDVCTLYKLLFDSTKEMNLAIMDLEKYYGPDRPFYTKHQMNGEEKLQIRHKLLKLLGKRSSKDLLEKKGIIRNEPIFGNTLKHLCEMYKQEVPEFVIRIMQIIEMPKNIKSVGLYRASGNLATIQKIRFHIDKNNLKILEEFRNDIDVLTGSLKLFFRELKEPLISHNTYEELCKLIDAELTAKAEDHIKQIVNKMDKPHNRTLLKLLEHLAKVESHSEDNRMDMYNISIVWGPTLIWPPDNCHENILLSHTNANKVIELLLNVYKKLYQTSQKHESSPSISKIENEGSAAKQKQALMIELNENLTHTLRSAGSKDNLVKSTDSLPKSGKSPDKEIKFDLEQLCATSKEKIPEFVLKAVPLIEKGINLEHLYRRTGSNEKLEKIKKKIYKNRSNLSSMEKYNVHDLACALKTFFAELRTPLVSKELYDRLVAACDERNEVTKLRNAKRELTSSTVPHRETLEYLFRHLVKITWHEESNKMSKHNVATEWGPVVFRALVENGEAAPESCVRVAETLLQIYDTRTIVNMETERDLKHNLDVYNSIYNNNNERAEEGRTGRSPEKSNQVLPPVFKRKPRILKNDSSLYRVSRYITNTLSLYDNVHYEDIKDEARVLETAPRTSMENRTKL